MQIKYGVDNIFDYLPDNITTVNVVLDSINFNLNEFDIEIENIVKKLDGKHSDNDDFFDTDANRVLTEKEIFQKYDLEMVT